MNDIFAAFYSRVLAKSRWAIRVLGISGLFNCVFQELGGLNTHLILARGVREVKRSTHA